MNDNFHAYSSLREEFMIWLNLCTVRGRYYSECRDRFLRSVYYQLNDINKLFVRLDDVFGYDFMLESDPEDRVIIMKRSRTGLEQWTERKTIVVPNE